MADFSQPLAADRIMERADINTGTSGSLSETTRHSDELWTEHDAHWSRHFQSRPYAQADRGYDHYRPAYRYGHDAAHRHAGRDWHDVEPELERGWDTARGSTSHSTWHEAKDAARDAWDRARGR